MKNSISLIDTELVRLTISFWLSNLCLSRNWSNLCKLFSSVQSFSCVRLFATPRTAARQASLSITNSWSLLKLMSIESVMPSNHLIFCYPLLLPSSIFPSILNYFKFSRVSWDGSFPVVTVDSSRLLYVLGLVFPVFSVMNLCCLFLNFEDIYLKSGCYSHIVIGPR